MSSNSEEEFFQYRDSPYFVSRAGIIKGVRKILKPAISKCGYARVLIINGETRKTTLVHRVVAETLIPNPLNLRVVNHKNGIKSDNRLENLEWCTQKQNIRHAHASGLCKKGEAHHSAKLTEDKVLTIITFLNSGFSCPDLEKMEYCSRQTANAIGSKRIWKHLDHLKSDTFKKLKIKLSKKDLS